MVGQLRVYSGNDVFFAPIIILVNDRVEFGNLKYEYGIAECFDFIEQDKIDGIEIDHLKVDRGVEYCKDVDVIKKYYDGEAGCIVIEFR